MKLRADYGASGQQSRTRERRARLKRAWHDRWRLHERAAQLVYERGDLIEEGVAGLGERPTDNHHIGIEQGYGASHCRRQRIAGIRHDSSGSRLTFRGEPCYVRGAHGLSTPT